MRIDEAKAEAVAARWIESTLASYPVGAIPVPGGARDRFRDPAGYTIRASLATLAREALGALDEKALAQALDEVVRLRAVQGLAPSEAIRFVFDLREAAAAFGGELPPDFEARVDRLALMAFDRYMACRDRVAELREKELRMRLHYAANARTEP